MLTNRIGKGDLNFTDGPNDGLRMLDVAFIDLIII